jgi:hypothetical protein
MRWRWPSGFVCAGKQHSFVKTRALYLMDALALPTPAKQCKPSLTTVLVGLKLRLAKVTISARRKPFTRRNCKRIGFPCGVVSRWVQRAARTVGTARDRSGTPQSA